MIAAVIQARMRSTRLPGKVLLPLAGTPVLCHVVERTRHARNIDKIIVATSTEPSDDAIVQVCEERGYSFFRGSHDDVLERYFGAAGAYHVDTVVRLTCDNPLIDPDIVDEVIDAFQKEKCDYMSNVLPGERTYPRGLDVEIFSFEALRKAQESAREAYEREHVTPYIHENKTGEFHIGKMVEAKALYARPQYRFALDYPEDYELISGLYERFYAPGNIVSVQDVIAFLDQHPELAAINAARDKEYPRQGIRR